MVFKVLNEVADKGINAQQIEAVLHQLELNQREIGGDHYPFGLQLILSGLSTAIHRGDVMAHMNLDKALQKLRKKAEEPEYVKNLVRQYLLDNPHRVRVTFKPDQKLEQRRSEAERKRLQAIKSQLSETQKQHLVELAKQLSERQNQQESNIEDILPKVTVKDVPETLKVPKCFASEQSALTVSHFNQGTNGLVYQQLIIDLPDLTDEEYQYLPIYNFCFGELGSGNRDYLDMQISQSLVSGGIHAHNSMRGTIHDEQQVKGFYLISGKALLRNHAKMTSLLKETFLAMRFDELERIKELISQLRMRKEQSVTGSGHSLAMQAASSGMSPVALLQHKNKGLESIAFLKKLDSDLQSDNSDNALDKLINQLKAIHYKLTQAPAQFLIICEKEAFTSCEQDILNEWHSHNFTTPATERFLQLDSTKSNVKQAWLTSTQVNFCAHSYATVPVEHPDAAPLTILGGFLRNGFLHRSIREQGGAYGGGASQDSANACFKFFSYRDPRLSETLNDFSASIDWLLDNEHDEQALEEAILGVISNLDKPASPAGDAKQAFHNSLFGRSAEQRQAFRQRILSVTIGDLLRVAKKYLKEQSPSIAVISNYEHESECRQLGLELIHLG